jgi:hypothetical protein
MSPTIKTRPRAASIASLAPATDAPGRVVAGEGETPLAGVVG